MRISNGYYLTKLASYSFVKPFIGIVGHTFETVPFFEYYFKFIP